MSELFIEPPEDAGPLDDIEQWELVVLVDPHIQDLRDRENEINDWKGNDPGEG